MANEAMGNKLLKRLEARVGKWPAVSHNPNRLSRSLCDCIARARLRVSLSFMSAF